MSERTPLIRTVVVTRREPRYPHSTLRRFCTVCLGCLLILVLITFLVPFNVLRHRHHRSHFHDHFGNGHEHTAQTGPDSISWPSSSRITYDKLQEILLSTPDEARIRSWSEYYDAGSALCGKNLSQALWTRDRWEEFGIKSEVITYDVYLNYPISHRLALLKDNEVDFECSLEEDVIEEDPTSGHKERSPTFHGYSRSGNVTAPYVYVNFGTFADFEALIKANITLTGKIALAKYGANFRALKVERAQALGMVGVIMYTDPQEDGDITEANGYKPYPHGPARHPSAVQRGSASFGYLTPGDPTTPGWPSKPGAERADPEPLLPQIPSLPISYRDAIPLLKALNGHGPRADDLGKEWQGGGLAHKGVHYNIGPTPDSVTLNLFNDVEYVITPMWNVIGIINGSIPDETIVLGNHRDTWTVGGAGDPHSGSAALLEIVRGYGQALEAGWTPLRTIVFASWDGEEYGLMGSTEWVEEFLPWVSSSVVAYLNVDVGTRGKRFTSTCSPSLRKLIYDITAIVPSPAGGTVRDHWNGYIGILGYGSDHVAFEDHAGVASLDLGFNTDIGDAPYMYHSNFDSFTWMDKFGDSTWEYHATMAKVWGLLAAKLAESPVLFLNATDYAIGLKGYLDSIKPPEAEQDAVSAAFDYYTIDKAIRELHKAAAKFDAHASHLSKKLTDGVPWWAFWKKHHLHRAIRKVNTKYKHLEKQFLYAGGLDGRTWYKHVVFAPGRWTGYSGSTFPGLTESFDDRNLTNAKRWSAIIEDRILTAAAWLEG